MHEEIAADKKDVICANVKQETKANRKVFIRKWRLKCPAVASSLEEASDNLSLSGPSQRANGNQFEP